MNKEELKKRERLALDSIKSVFGTDDDKYSGTMFVFHHLEKMGTEYWVKYLGISNPEPIEVLNILQLKSHCEEGSLFDFTLPEEVTDYVVSVHFDKAGKVEEISMES